MQKTIAINEFPLHMQDVLDEVTSHHTAYVLTLGNQPQAAVVPYDEFCRFQAFLDSAARRRWDQLLDRMAEHNSGFSEQAVAEDVAAALSELDG